MRRKLCFVATIPFAVNAFLRPHLMALSEDSDVTVCTRMSDLDVPLNVPAEVRVISIPIVRRIDLWRDFICLVKLLRIFRQEKFDTVFTITPKAGLLSMAAGLLARVPCRIHCFTGQVWATRQGLARVILKWMDKILCYCATRLLADSSSQRDFLLSEEITSEGKMSVLGNGSIAGVDPSRFHPDELRHQDIRRQLGISSQAICMLYVGRLARERGMVELIAAFDQLAPRYPDLHLLLVGPDEEGFSQQLKEQQRIHLIGYTSAPEHYMMAADIFCLPSYREGFGVVLIEAAAVGLPVVASRIYGITDAVVDGITGLLHPAGDVAALVSQLEILLKDPELRRRLATNGMRRAHESFEVSILTKAMSDFLTEECA